MNKKLISRRIFRYIILAFFVLLFIISIFIFDPNVIRDSFYNTVSSLNNNRFFSTILIFLLFLARSISIIVPVLPGTIFSVAAAHANDFELFMELGEQGKSLISPIPGYATHGETKWLCPLVNWEALAKEE